MIKWLNLVWDNLDKAQGLALLERNCKSWIESYFQKWKSLQKLIELYSEIDELFLHQNSSRFVILGSCRNVDLLYIENLEICSEYSQVIPEKLLKIQNKRIEFESWTNDLKSSIKVLKKIQDYLNPDFLRAWPDFLKHVDFLVSEGIYAHNRHTVIDFLDHCIAWSLVLEVPYLRLLPRERIWWFNEVFLEYVYRNKHQVEDWAQCYISSENFIVGFHQWCIEEDLIPEIRYQDEEQRPANSLVRIRL